MQEGLTVMTAIVEIILPEGRVTVPPVAGDVHRYWAKSPGNVRCCSTAPESGKGSRGRGARERAWVGGNLMPNLIFKISSY